MHVLCAVHDVMQCFRSVGSREKERCWSRHLLGALQCRDCLVTSAILEQLLVITVYALLTSSNNISTLVPGRFRDEQCRRENLFSFILIFPLLQSLRHFWLWFTVMYEGDTLTPFTLQITNLDASSIALLTPNSAANTGNQTLTLNSYFSFFMVL